MVTTALPDGSYDRPAHCSVPTTVNGSSWPGSPTNSARSNSRATASRASERIWYASSTIACRHGASVRTHCHLADVEITTSCSTRSATLSEGVTLACLSTSGPGRVSAACSRPIVNSGAFSASRPTRSSTWLLVWATIISRSPASTSSRAARTTSVDFPAPGGESTTTPRGAPVGGWTVAARMRATAASAAAPGDSGRADDGSAITPTPRRRTGLRRWNGRVRARPRAGRRGSTGCRPARAAARTGGPSTRTG